MHLPKRSRVSRSQPSLFSPQVALGFWPSPQAGSSTFSPGPVNHLITLDALYQVSKRRNGGRAREPQEEPKNGHGRICFNVPRVFQGQALLVALRRSQPFMFQDTRHFAQQLASMACLPARSDTVSPSLPCPVAKARLFESLQVTMATSGLPRNDVHRVLCAVQPPVPGGWSGLHRSAPTPARPPGTLSPPFPGQ